MALANKHEFAEYVREQYENDPNGSFDRFGKEYIEDGSFDIRLVGTEDELSWGESYIGTSFGSTVDYGDTYNQLQNGDLTEAELKRDVRDRISRHPRQINFVKKEDREVVGVYTGVVIKLRKNGYAIYPDEESVVEF